MKAELLLNDCNKKESLMFESITETQANLIPARIMT
jgi:hypothetical protein